MSTALSLPPIEQLAAIAAELADQAQAAGDRPTFNATNKAIAELHSGCAPIPTIGGFLLESRTRGGVVHRLSVTYGCSCEAAQAQRLCWHRQLMVIVERAAEAYTMPALASRDELAAPHAMHIVADVIAGVLQRHGVEPDAATQARWAATQAAVDELFA